ncbi:acyltransferase [Kitasatospora sp. LaBMicrA B282]|uniref:acyltransferase n=1 Tax=Kitasatospora sp. LaBMicrA B282 TaxID=3420949 RepID=UPI003D10A8B8
MGNPGERTLTVRGGGTATAVRLNVRDLRSGPIYTPRVFCYRETLDGEKLRASLAAVLRHYPVVSGRLRKAPEGLEVDCNDAGIRFTEVEAPGAVPEFGPDRRIGAALGGYLDRISPLHATKPDTPLLTVRLTNLAGGGSVLGVALHHYLADGAGLLRFLAHWSHEHRGLPFPEPHHERELIDRLGDAAGPGAAAHSSEFTVVGRLRLARFVLHAALAGARLDTVTLRFTAAELAALKAAASAEGADGVPLSGNDALTAHLWRLFSELRDRPDQDGDHLGLIAGLGRLPGLGLPEQYWGNAVCHLTTTMTAAEARTAPLGAAATAVRAALGADHAQRIRDEVAYLRTQRAAGRAGRVLPRAALSSYDTEVLINNQSRFPYYEIDLGAGTPFWCEQPAAPVPYLVDVMPTPGASGGRDVHLSLPRAHAAALGGAGWQQRVHAYA